MFVNIGVIVTRQVRMRMTVRMGMPVKMGVRNIDFRMPDLDWRKTRPALAAWEAVMAERPSLAQTKPA